MNQNLLISIVAATSTSVGLVGGLFLEKHFSQQEKASLSALAACAPKAASKPEVNTSSTLPSQEETVDNQRQVTADREATQQAQQQEEDTEDDADGGIDLEGNVEGVLFDRINANRLAKFAYIQSDGHVAITTKVNNLKILNIKIKGRSDGGFCYDLPSGKVIRLKYKGGSYVLDDNCAADAITSITIKTNYGVVTSPVNFQ